MNACSSLYRINLNNLVGCLSYLSLPVEVETTAKHKKLILEGNGRVALSRPNLLMRVINFNLLPAYDTRVYNSNTNFRNSFRAKTTNQIATESVVC